MSIRTSILAAMFAASAFATTALAHDPSEFDRRMAAPTAIPTSCAELADFNNFSTDVTNPGVLELKTHCDKLRKKAEAKAAKKAAADAKVKAAAAAKTAAAAKAAAAKQKAN